MFSLPDELVPEMQTYIPKREQDPLVASFLEKDIEARKQRLYQKAAELEACADLKQEMAEWDIGLEHDGLYEL